MSRIRMGIVTLISLLVAGPATAATVYDFFSGGFSGGLGFSSVGTELAQKITLGGVDRTVTQIEIAVLTTSPPVDSSRAVNFYLADGPGGAPGTSLFSSGLQSITVTGTSGSPNIIPFSVPNIVVPDSFFYSVDNGPVFNFFISSAAAGPIGSADEFWQFDGTTWTQQSISFMAARITAIPEPGTALLLGAGLLGLAAFGRRRKA